MPIPTPRPGAPRLMLALAAITAAFLAILGAAAPAARAATTPVYAGTGWKADTANGIYSVSPDPYTIVFADATARTKLSGYFTRPATQLAGIGIKLTVSTTIDTSTSLCPARHRIIVHYTYRPLGVKGMSQARSCYDMTDGSAWGGHILMDTEYWTSSSWFSTTATLNEVYRRNAVTHELGHILGLAHPNYDRDKDGRIEDFECVKNTSSWTPVLCAPNGGNRTATYAGNFVTAYDLAGLKQLLANYYARQTT
ncbi:hypothetical protein [Streptomyces longwoodensis]|uniref:hypothetical protein n=1 Tax=Streptomyces longwoodensis TaxID=68231 RepID=UPI00224CF548|nr:hypothetical protein [Streptomyces longwoodensis]MCX5000913.1 hypothetical protein [Streptomyces longwoodensis]